MTDVANESRPAPYGNSCSECSRAKCKCIIEADGQSCQRCKRLRRDCRPSIRKRKRQSVEHASYSQSNQNESTNTTARLERKIDALAASIRQHVSTGSTPASDPPNGDTTSSATHDLTLHGVSAVEAEAYLKSFKTYHSRYFPFVYIPPDLTAAELQVQRPYLWLAILTTGSYSILQQQHLGDLFRREIADAMVVRSEKSIDLLLGLLTFIGWFHNQFKAFIPDGSRDNPKTSLCMLTQLAISLVFDLHLNKPAAMDPHQNLGVRFYNHPDHPRQLTMEEMRAALGCFLITSIISAYLQKTDSLRWTSRLNDCLRKLNETPECEGDEVLVLHVRMQLVAEKAVLSNWYDSSLEPVDRLRVPSVLVFQSSCAQLEHLKSDLLEHLRDNKIVLAHLHSTELSIAEMALWETSADHDRLSFTRQKLLLACFSAAKAWLEIFQSFSATEHVAFPFSFASQYSRCLGMLIHLSTLETPGWDTEMVRKEVDVVQIIDQIVGRLEQGIASIQPAGNDNIFARHCSFWKSIRPSLLSKLAKSGYTTARTMPPAPGDLSGGFTSDLLNWDFFDNEWLSSLNWLGTDSQMAP